MVIGRTYEGAPVSMAALSLAAAAAVALHVVLLAGWQRDPGHVMESRFIDDGRIVDFLPSDASQQLWQLIGPKEATVRCDIDSRGRLSNCSWIKESSPGMGDMALADVKQWRRLSDPTLRGQRGVEFSVCIDGCGIP